MSANLGSWQHAGVVARGAVGGLGYSRLGMMYAGVVATYGTVCVLTDVKIRELAEMRRPDGRQYHVGSLGRIRRQLAADGILTSERVYVGGTLPLTDQKGKPWKTSRGTTLKRFVWNAVREKNPFSRRQQRICRQEQARKLRECGDIEKAPPKPRFIATQSEHRHHPSAPLELLDPDLARTINAARRASEARDTGRAVRVERAPPPERPPPE